MSVGLCGLPGEPETDGFPKRLLDDSSGWSLNQSRPAWGLIPNQFTGYYLLYVTQQSLQLPLRPIGLTTVAIMEKSGGSVAWM